MKLCEIFAKFCGTMAVESSRRSRTLSMETGGLPLVSTIALLTIVAGQLQGSGYTEAEPEFLSPLENVTLAQGRDIHFTCTVNHLGGYKVAWIKSDTKTILAIHTHMVTLNPRLSVTHNGHNTWKLYISNVEPKDSGTYMCQINTDPMMSQMGHLSVVIPPDIADGDGSDASAREGGSVELHCSATGVPEPSISWKRMSGRSIVFRGEGGKEDKVVDSFVGSTLALKNLRRADMGTYLCIAANGVPPTKSRLYEVAVHFEPVVKVVSPVVLRSVNMQVTLQCYVEAAPRSLNVWQRGKEQTGGKLLNSSKYVISEEPASEYAVRMNLTINRLKKSDFGEYSCLANNGFGKADGVIILKETPQRTTTTTSTSTTTTTTTPRPPPTQPSPPRTPQRIQPPPTRAPNRHQPKQHASQNALDYELRQVELNNALNFYNSAYATNNSQQRTERQKIKPTVSPRQYNDYISAAGARCVNAGLVLLIAVSKLCM